MVGASVVVVVASVEVVVGASVVVVVASVAMAFGGCRPNPVEVDPCANKSADCQGGACVVSP